MRLTVVQDPSRGRVEFYGRNCYRDASRYCRANGLPPPAKGAPYRGGRKPGAKNISRTVEAEDSTGLPEPVMSYGEIAAELGISWQRVQQIECAAIRKIRRELAKRGITKLEDLT